MVNYRKMFWGCLLGSLLATGAMACLVAYSFAHDTPANVTSDRPYLNETAPGLGQLNEVMASEAPRRPVEAFAAIPAIDVDVPLGGLSVDVVAPGVDVTVGNPACPPGGCPAPGTPAAYPSGDLTGYAEPASYETYEDDGSYDGGGGAGGGGKFLGKGGRLRGFIGKCIPTRKNGPVRRLCGRLCGGGR